MADDALRLVLTWAAYLAFLVAALYGVAWPVLWLVGRWGRTSPRAQGWRPWAAWLFLVVLIASTAAPLGADVKRRARIAKARGDVLRLGKAVAAYVAHCGGPPAVGAADGACRIATGAARGPLPRALITPQRNARGIEAGPFVEFLPRLPRGWTGADGAYAYVVTSDGRARVCATGDGVTLDSAAPARGTRDRC